MIDIFVENNQGFGRESLKNLVKKTATLTINELKPSCQAIPFYVSILLTNNERIKKINNKYRKIKNQQMFWLFHKIKRNLFNNLIHFFCLEI